MKFQFFVQAMDTDFRGDSSQRAEALTADDTVVIHTVGLPPLGR